MKSLQEYVDEALIQYRIEKKWSYYDDCLPYHKILEYRKDLIEWLCPDGDYPEGIIEKHHNEIIGEMLNFHSVTKLISKLKENFPQDILSIYKVNHDEEVKGIELKDGVCIETNDDSFVNTERFNNIMHYFNYFYTQTNHGRDREYILLEPHFSKKVNVEERNHAWAFHITTENELNNILNKGLLPKGSKDKEKKGKEVYRYYPERIYLILPHSSDKSYVRKKIEEVIRMKGKDDFVVLKIDLHHIKDSFYEDVTMPSKEDYVYTYQEIPSIYIKDITKSFKK